MEHDKGFVFGSTWHSMPQYVVLDRFVSIEEAESVFDYELEKQPLFRLNSNGFYEPTGCYGIVRTDTDTLLTQGLSIGERFTIESNLTMLRRIDENILSVYPDLKIESVGTLFNGQTAFISLKVSDHAVRGDHSNTETNLLFCNPLGKGSYLAYAHSTRVVCNNTLSLSKATGEANKSMRKFSHTKNAGEKIEEHMIDLSKVFLGLEEHKADLEKLAGMPIDDTFLNTFCDQIFPIEGKSSRGISIATKGKDKVLEIFDRQKDHMTLETAESRYGLLQAFTEYIDHETVTRSNTDEASLLWDSITGSRSNRKDQAFELLLNS